MASFYHKLSLHTVRKRGKILILMYHRVLPSWQAADMLIQPGMFVTDDTFEMQLHFLKSYCDMISFREFLRRHAAHEWDHNKRYCVITFDDGWNDNYTCAYPLLKKHCIPATIFLTTSYIGSVRRFWPEELAFLLGHLTLSHLSSAQHDKLFSTCGELKIESSLVLSLVNTVKMEKRREILHRIIERLKYFPERSIQHFLKILREYTPQNLTGANCAFLDWPEIEEMSCNNISFGSHCAHHRILTHLSPSEIEEEMNNSFETLKARKLDFLPVLSYPNGNYNQDIIRCAHKAGYQAAVTTLPGWVDPYRSDLFSLRRINVHNDISHNLSLFAFHISAAFN